MVYVKMHPKMKDQAACMINQKMDLHEGLIHLDIVSIYDYFHVIATFESGVEVSFLMNGSQVMSPHQFVDPLKKCYADIMAGAL